MASGVHVLFVDDQWCTQDGRDVLIGSFGSLLKRDPPYVFHYETAETYPGYYGCEPVLARLRASPVDALVLDIIFGDKSDRLGLEILNTVRDAYPTLPVFMMTVLERDYIDVVERAMELGANEYLVKKPLVEEFERVLRIYTHPAASEADYAIWGNSSAVRQLRATIARLSISGTASVLVTGESGTGKELVARAIHRQGPRRRGPFVDKNCAHEKSDILDSDLFGHERGAFTGATHQHIGRIERANGGILFLDEIGSTPQGLQAKLLRVLETKTFQRLGGREDITSDFQVICATNEDPARMVKEGRLREDLYYRIKQFDIDAPPLRQRPGDVRILAELFLRRFKAGPGASYPAATISSEALGLLSSYPWPGNIRELKNVVERATILARDAEIGIASLPPEVVGHEVPQRRKEDAAPSTRNLPILGSDPRDWPRQRLLAEICLCVEAKKRIQAYKSSHWKAEFMRLMYPECKAASAKGFDDLVKRLTKGPWGILTWQEDEELRALLKELED